MKDLEKAEYVIRAGGRNDTESIIIFNINRNHIYVLLLCARSYALSTEWKRVEKTNAETYVQGKRVTVLKGSNTDTVRRVRFPCGTVREVPLHTIRIGKVIVPNTRIIERNRPIDVHTPSNYLLLSKQMLRRSWQKHLTLDDRLAFRDNIYAPTTIKIGGRKMLRILDDFARTKKGVKFIVLAALHDAFLFYYQNGFKFVDRDLNWIHVPDAIMCGLN